MEESAWVFVCLEVGYNVIISVYQDVIKAQQTWKIPGNVLEFCSYQMRKTLFVQTYTLCYSHSICITYRVNMKCFCSHLSTKTAREV